MSCCAGVSVYKRWSAYQPMFTTIPGWNVDATTGARIPPSEMSHEDQDLSMITVYKSFRKRRAAEDGMGPTTKPSLSSGVPATRDDTAHPV